MTGPGKAIAPTRMTDLTSDKGRKSAPKKEKKEKSKKKSSIPDPTFAPRRSRSKPYPNFY